MYKTDLITPLIVGLNTYPTTDLDLIPVNSGWQVGMYFQNTGTIPFDYDSEANPAYYTINNYGEPMLGATITTAGTTDRYYSFMAYGYKRSAEITFPKENGDRLSELSITFTASVIDSQNNNPYFAIRKGSCSGVDMWANVGSKNDPLSWEKEESFSYNFSTTADVSGWGEGMYCFVFRARRSGVEDIRLTRTFYLDDGDTIFGVGDYCPGTSSDESELSETLGVKRHYWIGRDNFTTLVPARKGSFDTTISEFSIADTDGCSCIQILDLLKNAGLGEFGGHYKFGCSKSILQDFILDMNDGELDGKYYIETVTVPANKSIETLSAYNLVYGTSYVFLARGTANAGDGIEFDARYSFRTPTSTEWTDYVSNYVSYGNELLDLYFDGSTPWGDYNSSHEYEYMTVGDGNKASFLINDIYPSNNTGNLYVDIYGVL